MNSDTQEIRVTNALSKIKMYTKQINEYVATNHNMCAACNVNSASLDNGVDKNEFTKKVLSEYQSFQDKIKRLSALRRAVVQSNATTIVKIPTINQEMSVAEAIMLKNDVDIYKELLRTLRSSYSTALSMVEAKNAKAESKASDARASITNGDTSNEDIVRIAQDNYNTLYNRLRYEIVDPLDIINEIKKYMDLIDMLESDLDHVLSISNASTVITI